VDIVTRLETARIHTLEYFEPSDEQPARSYVPGKWSVKFILHHLTDAETVLFDGILTSEPKQVLWALDQDAWGSGRDYFACRSVCPTESRIQGGSVSSI
jgi:hypothetical protein